MNPAQIRELVEFFPAKSKYLAFYWDEPRNRPFWQTGRSNAPMSPEIYWTVAESFDCNLDQLERDSDWLLVDLESGEASVLPWQEADELMQAYHRNNPMQDLDIEFNALSVGQRLSSQWSNE
jgi:8-oxo-dGTP pyrophosphatase MutT (NUDIX family)